MVSVQLVIQYCDELKLAPWIINLKGKNPVTHSVPDLEHICVLPKGTEKFINMLDLCGDRASALWYWCGTYSFIIIRINIVKLAPT